MIDIHLNGLHVDPSSLRGGRKYFRDTKEPYLITLAGESIYVLTSPRDVADVYKNTLTISWYDSIRDLYRWIGLSPSSIEKMWSAPSIEKKHLNPKARPSHEMVVEYHRQQLLPGSKVNILLAEKLIPSLCRSICWESVEAHPACLKTSTDSVTISLWNWCAETFIIGTTSAYYGERLSKMAPDLLKPFLIWESTNWKYMYRLPSSLSGDMLAAKDEIIDTFHNYFKTSESKRKDAIWYVGVVEDELRQSGLGSDEIAKINMLLHWAYVFLFPFPTPHIYYSMRKLTQR